MSVPFTPTSTQLDRLLYSCRDFQLATSALQFIFEELDFDQEYGYVERRKYGLCEESAIISFCRPIIPSRMAQL